MSLAKKSKVLFYTNLIIIIVCAIVGLYSGIYASDHITITQYFDYVKPLRKVYIWCIPVIAYGIWCLIYCKKSLKREYFYQGNIVLSYLIIGCILVMYIFAMIASVLMLFVNFIRLFL